MKALCLNGSPKKEGNTFCALSIVMKALAANSVTTELVHIGGKAIRGCTDCRVCIKRQNGKCAIDDHLNDAIQRARDVDALIIGSPVYFSNVTPEVKAFIDRCGRVSRANDFMLERKLGAPVVVARRAGKTATVAAINFFFLANRMIVPGSNYWNGLIGKDPGDVLQDQEGVENLKMLAEQLAWMGKALS